MSMNIADICEMDHFVTLVDNKENIFPNLKTDFEDAGFPISLESGKSGEGFKTVTLHIGRSYFEFLRIAGDNTSQWDPVVEEWFGEGIRGVVMLFLHSREIDVIYKNLHNNGLFVKEPYRDYYSTGGEKKSFPWRYLNLPIIGSLPLWIRFVEYDTMLWNMLRANPRPNSKFVNGVELIDSLRISGPFTSKDIKMLEKVFPELKSNKRGKAQLRKGSLFFERAKNTGFAFECSAGNDEYSGRTIQRYNFSINVKM